ncbi:MAG: response regulator transcription factor [Elusimicrobia bacterium]|nr:response regulator transcription factor [Elusimicrobiota bacterium]
MSKTILLVEDEPNSRAIAQAALSGTGYRVIATDGVTPAWHIFTNEKPDLAVVDINLPDGSGLDLCKKIRSHPELGTTPVVILTGQSGFENKAEGFSAGADQYLVKPVAPQELILWVEALLRRLAYDTEEGDTLKAGDCEIQVKSHIVTYKGEPITNLTGKEFDLLWYLVKNRPKVMSRKQILSKLWHTITVDHVVDTHLTNLRKKLPQELADKIQTIPGKGFRFLE